MHWHWTLTLCVSVASAFFLPRHPHRQKKSTTELRQTTTKNVVVIGGGWAGFSAADALSRLENVQVHLLDASPRARGGLAAGWTSPRLNLPVEAGVHGFWREYRNTFAIMESIGLDLDDVLTPYTPSILVSEAGRVAVAPVLGEAAEYKDSTKSTPELRQMEWSNLDDILKSVGNLLPSPLDVALLSRFDDASLSYLDRLSALGLLGIWADFGQEDAASWERYDSLSAETLFRDAAGVSPRLYQQLVSPLLHVLPMAPGYDCSAAAALSCFHVFALQAKGAFDVRWCRGTITERVFDPWSKQLQDRGVMLRGSTRVTSIQGSESNTFVVTVNNETTIPCDGVVLAVGATAARRLVSACPSLSVLPQTKDWCKLRGITCVAVRLFLHPDCSLAKAVRQAMLESPVVVCGPRVGGIAELSETGFCIYDLQRLQDSFSRLFADNKCFALEVDFFRAGPIADLADSEIKSLILRVISAALDLEDAGDNDLFDQVIDLSVVRARNAVSHFCVGSSSVSPTGTRLRPGIYVCGDWVDRRGHASWSTEKAVVTGRQAALAFSRDFNSTTLPGVELPPVIPAVPDSPQLKALRQLSLSVRGLIPNTANAIPLAPWVLLRQLLAS